MAMFIARISRGRTVRQIILLIAVAAPIITCFWFTILGGSGLYFEIENPGSISVPFGSFNLPAALFAIIDQLPFSFIISILFLILTTIFVATTGNSMTFAISMVMTGSTQPPKLIRVLGCNHGTNRSHSNFNWFRWYQCLTIIHYHHSGSCFINSSANIMASSTNLNPNGKRTEYFIPYYCRRTL